MLGLDLAALPLRTGKLVGYQPRGGRMLLFNICAASRLAALLGRVVRWTQYI